MCTNHTHHIAKLYVIHTDVVCCTYTNKWMKQVWRTHTKRFVYTLIHKIYSYIYVSSYKSVCAARRGSRARSTECKHRANAHWSIFKVKPSTTQPAHIMMVRATTAPRPLLCVVWWLGTMRGANLHNVFRTSAQRTADCVYDYAIMLRERATRGIHICKGCMWVCVFRVYNIKSTHMAATHPNWLYAWVYYTSVLVWLQLHSAVWPSHSAMY